MYNFLYTVTPKNLLLKSLFLFINTSTKADYWYAIILAIGSEENSVAFYLKSETESYYFSLAALLKNIQIIILLPFATT